MRSTKRSVPDVITASPLLTVLVVKDEGRYMAKCPELDLVTEMDTSNEVLKAIVGMIKEYAEDYRERERIYLGSPNRAHHKPYVDRILACKNDWELMELVGVRYGHLQL